MKTPTELLIRCIENLDDVEQVLVIRKHRNGAITFEVNTGHCTDSYALANIVSAFTLADILQDQVKNDF